MIRVPVDLGDRSYDVLVGAGARHRLCEVIPAGATRAAVVAQPDADFPVDAGIEQRTFLLDEGRRPSAWRASRSCAGASPGGG